MAKGETTMRFTSVALGIAAISLLLLLLLLVLVYDRFPARTPLPTVPISANTNTLVDTVPTTASDSTRQAVATGAQLAASTITSTTNITTSSSVPETWQRFSSKTARYSILHPPQSRIIPLSLLPSTVEHTQITLPSAEDTLASTIDVRVYDNQAGIPVRTFLSELYRQMFRKAISPEILDELMGHPLEIAGVQGYEMDLIIGSTEVQILIPHQNYFYLFILGHEFGPVDSSAEDIERFRRIISTLEFD